MWFLGVAAHRLIAYTTRQPPRGEAGHLHQLHPDLHDPHRRPDRGPQPAHDKGQNAKPDITNVSSRECSRSSLETPRARPTPARRSRTTRPGSTRAWACRPAVVVTPGRRSTRSCSAGCDRPARCPVSTAARWCGDSPGRTPRTASSSTSGRRRRRPTATRSARPRGPVGRHHRGRRPGVRRGGARRGGEGLGRRQSLFKMMDVTNAVQESSQHRGVDHHGRDAGIADERRAAAGRAAAGPGQSARRFGPPPAAPPPVVPPKLPPNVPPPWMLPPPGGTPPPPIRPGL